MPRRKPVFKIIFSTVAIILLILAALIYIPLTEKLNYDMTGYIIQPNGEIMEQFTFSITGKEYDFIIDGLKSGRISFSGNKLREIGRDAFILHFDWDSATFSKRYTFGTYTGDYHLSNDQLVHGSLCYYNGLANDIYYETGILDLENGTFCMYADDLVGNAFIVGTSDPNDDPMEVIERYQEFVKAPY